MGNMGNKQRAASSDAETGAGGVRLGRRRASKVKNTKGKQRNNDILKKEEEAISKAMPKVDDDTADTSLVAACKLLQQSVKQKQGQSSQIGSKSALKQIKSQHASVATKKTFDTNPPLAQKSQMSKLSPNSKSRKKQFGPSDFEKKHEKIGSGSKPASRNSSITEIQAPQLSAPAMEKRYISEPAVPEAEPGALSLRLSRQGSRDKLDELYKQKVREAQKDTEAQNLLLETCEENMDPTDDSIKEK